MRAVTHQLPAGWTTRRPTLDDVPEILAVVQASDIAAVGTADFTAGEVREILTAPYHDPEKDSWVALDERGRIAAWAYLDNTTASVRDLLDNYCHPDFGQPAQPVLLDLVLARIAERAVEFGYPEMIARAGAVSSETYYLGILADAGFAFVKRYARMKRELAGGERPPTLPDGVTIRPVEPGNDAEMRIFHRILEDAFKDLPDYLPFDYDTYRERLAALPSIAWDEWFITHVNGAPAGILQSADQSLENNEGWVKNLAVAREFRGRGLGVALLRTAFATYAAKGRTSVGLGVDMTNPTAAYRLYTGVGMAPEYEVDMLERTIRPQ